ncbi:MAG: 4-(cytidine 5'-diphospho)-2-C-methyl-D-erythritol kinase [Immundisolibacter sp.]|uniref:4-(cytidine 5'-diphospho)-2-C-methyl-D-erythritol kinase n=1 Tax=Immundisolibacter sp. TaxID=1934948 RepID=UPI0019ABF762|nr:4-(cytidine 5'-diphospho)-2-C-methyl-D-erythritol kinase [Immundisolibacter sp.]MBC7161604.1 4-(cytidine 5'-diphospho)-2-C-methyl-D-erythritol kinase [Immundisolibacter sp.]
MPPESRRTWPAPAKINLFLHIVGRRADGYHLLQTVFQFVDLCDELRFRPRDDDQIRMLKPLPGVPPQQDLCVRAAQALRAHTGCRLGVDIELSKRIPMGGGLGGGSSDAATTLLALNRLWRLDLPRDELAAIGLALGADVPVFVGGRAAWAEGVGERLTPIELDEPWYLIVDPGVAVATTGVFGHPKLTRDTPPITISQFRSGPTGNDCLAVVSALYPQIDAAYRWLARFGQAHLSGTGGCLFVRFDARQAADAARAQLPAPWRGWVARGLNRHPLLPDPTPGR